MSGLVVFQRIGLVLMLFGLLLGILGALFKGRFSARLMNAGFVLVCIAALWMLGLYFYELLGA